MLKIIGIALLCATSVAATSSTISAADYDYQNLPTEFDAKSKYRLNYDDLNNVLSGSVLVMGQSSHMRAPKPKVATGSSIQLGNTLPTRLEGNRVMLHAFDAERKDILNQIRDNLLNLPNQLPIEKLKRREQLAYWLNLHNSIVLAKIADLYPVTLIKKVFAAERSDAFIYDREFLLGDQLISLADIQNHVTQNWDEPTVIYGFYLAAVGTPNIRDTAFTGKTVYADLKDNAADFVNSVRGTQIWGKTKLRVSTYYANFDRQFPNFDEDILAHVKQYADGKFKRRLKKVKSVTADVSDWHIADIYNGKTAKGATTFAATATDGNGRRIRTGQPSHVTDLLRERMRRIAKQKAVTGVESVKAR
ncbi:MAG: hypothetical protein COB37_09965 [Kordiimonadales bacterium]|nr:MAG: hypothetical protein COB37_09965 [Kordiimonadales bacterium]